MRPLIVGFAVLLSFAAPARGEWETAYSEYQKRELSFKLGYLDGFLQGQLMHFFVGDREDMREHLKKCLAFASPMAIDQAMTETVNAKPELRMQGVGLVLMQTLFRMCGGLPN